MDGLKQNSRGEQIKQKLERRKKIISDTPTRGAGEGERARERQMKSGRESRNEGDNEEGNRVGK
jgi:hypothetical protein